MAKIILFSRYSKIDIESLIKEACEFAPANPNILILPANGTNYPEEYKETNDSWFKKYSPREISIINEETDKATAKEKVRKANIILATGGNTCNFLKWLKELELVEPIRSKFTEDDFVWIGFSAGACILSPTIELTTKPPWNENDRINLTDFSALNIIDFEIWPHYIAEDNQYLEEYKSITKNKIKTLRDDEFMII